MAVTAHGTGFLFGVMKMSETMVIEAQFYEYTKPH